MMTFAAFVDSLSRRGIEVACDRARVETEWARPDGLIPVKITHRPWYQRVQRAYRIYRDLGMARRTALRWALFVSH